MSVKTKTRRELQEEYAKCVVGLGFFFAGHLFNVSPVINSVTVSGYTQRTSPKTGNVEDQYVYAVRFDRSTFSTLTMHNVDPVEAIANFEHRIDVTKTGELKPVVPLGSA